MNRSKIFFTFIVLISLTAILIAVSLFLYSEKQISELPFTASLALTSLIEKTDINQIQILFVGDIMLDRGIRFYAEKNGGNNFVFERIHNHLLGYDLVVANLEGPITDNKSVSIGAKIGASESFLFTFDPSWANTLFENNIRLVNLGNNHILDFGSKGFNSTKEYLEKAGIKYFGAPDHPKTATIEIKGVKITLVSYNEFNFYAGLEEKITIEEIQKAMVLKKQGATDIIIVYAHWGAEYAPEAPFEIKKLARKFIDAGADLIIGSHPHVIQPIEVYKGKRIYYSLGNFIFDQYFSEETKRGLAVIVKIYVKNKQLEFEEANFYTQENGQTITE